MKCLRVVRIDSPDGEIHFVFQEHLPESEYSECPNDFSKSVARKITKIEASKQLFLMRE